MTVGAASVLPLTRAELDDRRLVVAVPVASRASFLTLIS